MLTIIMHDRMSDFLGRMPKAVLLDCRDSEPRPVYTYESSSTLTPWRRI